jgi:hypothetical protein
VKPYYEHGGITIYHGDCREILPGIPGVAATITDPPYNVGVNYGQGADADKYPVEWHDARLALMLALCPSPEVVWFPGKVNVFRSGAVSEKAGLRAYWMLGWHRKEFAGDRWLGGPAICWEPIVWGTRSEKPAYEKIFGHMGRDFLVVNSTHGMKIDHPCPKPLRVMQWLVGLFAAEGQAVLDPFAGSGTTLLAAKGMQRQAIGIEQEERFCEIAARRLEQEVLDLGGAA